MRLVLALIQPTKLKPVQEALAEIGVERMTVCDALGYGQQRGQSGSACGSVGGTVALSLHYRRGLPISSRVFLHDAES